MDKEYMLYSLRQRKAELERRPSKGIMTDKKARELNVGGEILAFVW